ncbi:MAG TPA: hypothetical protein VM328_03760 [Fimbriimonadaceae bacterium]|nr:hypothetical protein [Fimbriimonadaceae bacterium]
MTASITFSDRFASALMGESLDCEEFDVELGTVDEARRVLKAVSRLGFRAELHPFRPRIRIFRDKQACADSAETGKALRVEALTGDGGFLSD